MERLAAPCALRLVGIRVGAWVAWTVGSAGRGRSRRGAPLGAGYGRAGRSRARHGGAEQGTARLRRRHGAARLGTAWLGSARAGHGRAKAAGASPSGSGRARTPQALRLGLANGRRRFAAVAMIASVSPREGATAFRLAWAQVRRYLPLRALADGVNLDRSGRGRGGWDWWWRMPSPGPPSLPRARAQHVDR